MLKSYTFTSKDCFKSSMIHNNCIMKKFYLTFQNCSFVNMSKDCDASGETCQYNVGFTVK